MMCVGGGASLKMAAQGSGAAFQEKVNRLLSRADGKPVLKPNKRLALRDSVANRRLRKGGKSARASLVFACGTGSRGPC